MKKKNKFLCFLFKNIKFLEEILLNIEQILAIDSSKNILYFQDYD